MEQVLNFIKIDKKLILSRCTICNTTLNTIEKSKVKNKIPRKVFENKDKFWFCNTCNKFYWMGSHYEKIVDKIDEIIKRKTEN